MFVQSITGTSNTRGADASHSRSPSLLPSAVVLGQPSSSTLHCTAPPSKLKRGDGGSSANACHPRRVAVVSHLSAKWQCSVSPAIRHRHPTTTTLHSSRAAVDLRIQIKSAAGTNMHVIVCRDLSLAACVSLLVSQ
jgi:hypothetical protein